MLDFKWFIVLRLNVVIRLYHDHNSICWRLWLRFGGALAADFFNKLTIATLFCRFGFQAWIAPSRLAVCVAHHFQGWIRINITMICKQNPRIGPPSRVYHSLQLFLIFRYLTDIFGNESANSFLTHFSEPGSLNLKKCLSWSCLSAAFSRKLGICGLKFFASHFVSAFI